MAFRNPRAAFFQAKGIAEAHNCYVVERSTSNGQVFLLYRHDPLKFRGIFLGSRCDAIAFFGLVDRVCNGVGCGKH
jgi:hypothetical protein